MGYGRRKDPNVPYLVRVHVVGKYRYAALHRESVGEVSGKRKRRTVHIGCLTENDVRIINLVHQLNGISAIGPAWDFWLKYPAKSRKLWTNSRPGVLEV